MQWAQLAYKLNCFWNLNRVGEGFDNHQFLDVVDPALDPQKLFDKANTFYLVDLSNWLKAGRPGVCNHIT